MIPTIPSDLAIAGIITVVVLVAVVGGWIYLKFFSGKRG